MIVFRCAFLRQRIGSSDPEAFPQQDELTQPAGKSRSSLAVHLERNKRLPPPSGSRTSRVACSTG